MAKIVFRAGTTVYQVVSTGMAFRGTVLRQLPGRVSVRWTEKRPRGLTGWERLEKGALVRHREDPDNLLMIEPEVVS